MQSRLNPNARISWLAVFVVIATLLFLETDFLRQAPAEGQSVGQRTTPGGDFPYTVRFEQGETKFVDCDKIVITEVRGTEPTMAPGNIYVIRGTFTLVSHDRAMLCASVTAVDAENGRCNGLKVQNAVVTQGTGRFTLYLPMSYRGWPHVSFYPAEGGNGFGGNYFGTGDSLHQQ
jgi:hypothetical protein